MLRALRQRLAILALAIGLLVPALGVVAVQPVGAVNLFQNICTGANDSKTNAGNTDVCQAATPSTTNPVVKVIGVVVDVLALIIGVAAVIVIILSGFRMITSQGDAQKVAAARMAIIYALVGIAIAITAGSIVSLVLNKL